MDAQRLAEQLRKPSGAEAAEVARNMNEANLRTNLRCIEALVLRAGESVLEIGPGNGAFVADIIAAAPGLRYTGLDWSEDMVAEAAHFNAALLEGGAAAFRQGSSDAMPFADAAFDAVLAVNVLYFWEHPRDHLAEIRRVLKPAGRLCIAFGDRGFMSRLPFTAHGFRLYDLEAASALLESCGFDVAGVWEHLENGRSNTGELVEKHIHILRCELRRDSA